MAMTTSGRTCLLVLGMHRSGTSALTRALSLLGAALPRRLIGVSRGNDAGHWEPSEIVAINDRLLAAAGSNWLDWRPLDFARLPVETLAGVRDEIARAIEEDYGDAPLIVLKDPRVCRLVPLYRSVLNQLGIAVRPILALRNPLEVVGSLVARDGIPARQSTLLWLRSNLEAERDSRDLPRTALDYHQFLAVGATALDGWDRQLGLTWPEPMAVAGPRITASLRGDLRHHARDGAALLADPLTATFVHDAYLALARLGDAGALARLDTIAQAVDGATPFLAATEADIRRLEMSARTAQRDLQRARQDLDRAHQDLDRERQEFEQERLQMASARDALHREYRNSTSWRMTAPLRSMKVVTSISGIRGGRPPQPDRGIAPVARKAITLLRQDGVRRVLRRAGRSLARGGVRSLVADIARVTGTGTDYAAWIARNETLTRDGLAELRRRSQAFPQRPLISILMPTYNTPAYLLRQAIESVTAQAYENWELCIADDASTAAEVRTILDGFAGRDPRIKVVHRAQNGHISQATNSAFELASGAWIALLDHDDELAPHALYHVIEAINRSPDAALIYSDEDKIDADGERSDPHFKCDYSPELIRSMNYLNHLTVHRADLVRSVGGWRQGFEGSQDYDLSLRILERIDPSSVVHIPRILYHWRAVSGSTALGGNEKSYPYEAGFRALQQHLQRSEFKASVESIPGIAYYRVRPEIGTPAPLVSLIIPTRDRIDLLEVAIGSIIEKTTYPQYEILIIDNNSEKPETFAYFSELRRNERVRVIRYPQPFNYSAINNEAVRHAYGSIIGLVNNDIEVITPDWLTEMVSWVQQERVGCVGAKLYYPDDRIQHAGVVLGIGGVAGHSHKYFRRGEYGYFSRLSVVQNLSAVTAACLLVRKSVYQKVGGLDDTELQIAFNDVDFCLKVRELGLDNVWTPFAELYHHESPSRGVEDTPEKHLRFSKEVQTMKDRWGDQLLNDPYYSPNLTLEREHFGIRV